jgi:Tfp pilus assembly protein PilZ
MPAAQTALANVQAALTQLQAQPAQHPAVMAAMEAVAGALGNVHSLTRFAPAAAPAQPARAPAQQPAAAYAQPPAAPAPAAYAPPAAYAQQAQPAQYAQPAAAPPRAQGPQGAKVDAAVVAAELGAHSQTNFYKGLSGNDIIDHGGLFVSTYKLPKIGQPVRLKVSMPGGYEFEANAVVRWCREQSEAGNDAPPGFGAQFVEITPEARQLVYRYVRNREPMFHDDL